MKGLSYFVSDAVDTDQRVVMFMSVMRWILLRRDAAVMCHSVGVCTGRTGYQFALGLTRAVGGAYLMPVVDCGLDRVAMPGNVPAGGRISQWYASEAHNL